MADDSLSEDEINALLSGIDNTLDTPKKTDTAASSPSSASSSGRSTDASKGLNLNTIKAAMDAVLSAQAKQFSTTYNKSLTLRLEDVTLAPPDEIKTLLPFPVVMATSKDTMALLSTQDALHFVEMITGSSPETMDDAAQSSLEALLNQFAETATQVLRDDYTVQADLSVTDMTSITGPAEIKLQEPKYLTVKCSFKTEGGVDSHYYQLYVPSPFNAIQAPTPTENASSPEDPFGSDETNLDSLLPGDAPDVKSAEFMPLSEGATEDHKENGNIGLLLDVPMEVTVELGRSTKSIKEILSLGGRLYHRAR